MSDFVQHVAHAILTGQRNGLSPLEVARFVIEQMEECSSWMEHCGETAMLEPECDAPKVWHDMILGALKEDRVSEKVRAELIQT